MRSVLVLACFASAAMAQAPIVTEFPPDAASITGEAIRTRIGNKVFNLQYASGPPFRVEYKSGGYAFVNTATGAKDAGKWSAEDNRLCVQWERFPSGCSEVRGGKEGLYVKRASNGEIVVLPYN